MATSSVVIAGATYSDVPSVTLKDTSNADVFFILTSDADATASDIRKNKIAYANGQKIVGDYELNLQEKTVTPSTSTQVVTADSGSVYSLNLESSNISTTGQRDGYYSYVWDISALWGTTPVVGEIYHINIDYNRAGYSAHYYYDDDYTFNGFPLSLTLSSSSAADRTLVLTETEIYVRASINDDDDQRTTLTYQVYKSVSYDGLSKVTVNPIPSEYIIPSGTLSVTANGTVDVSAYQYANVNVSGGSQTQSKTATPTKSTQTITPDSGYLLSSVVVNPIPSEYIIPNLQTRTGVTPTKSSQTITPSSGYDGLASVQINAIPSNYIDTTDATASASDIRSGKSAYVNGSKVNGSLVVNKVYVGSTDPASSFGNDGDIYIKVV